MDIRLPRVWKCKAQDVGTQSIVSGPPSSELQPILSLLVAALLEVVHSKPAPGTTSKHPLTSYVATCSTSVQSSEPLEGRCLIVALFEKN